MKRLLSILFIFFNLYGVDLHTAINVGGAYNQGLTGNGISVGVIDTPVRLDHEALRGHTSAYPYTFDPNWTYNDHGTHVAGIIAGNSSSLKGVAYNASIYAGGYLGYDNNGKKISPSFDFVKYFNDRPDVRIFNNSWGSSVYDLYNPSNKNDIALSYYKNYYGYSLNNDFSNKQNAVFVFAAGNDGRATPASTTLLPRYYGAGEKAEWISVGSLNTYGIKKNGSNLELTSGGVSSFSNLAAGAELWTIFAPGSNINSANSANGGYTLMSGTSMAAPVVSGAIALVMEKYPWLTGKQLADAVLTTANNTFKAPEYIIQTDSTNKKLIIRFIDGENKIPKTDTEKRNFVNSIFNNSQKVREIWGDGAIAYSYNDTIYIYKDGKNIAWFYGYYDNITFENLTREQVFGRGLLDISKAVNGIALLDANRMKTSDITTISELGGREEALETFDTQGYSGTFSNDIASRAWDTKYHHSELQNSALQNIDGIGLRKIGDGTLTLSGNNTYSGATIIEGGTLAIQGSVAGSGVVVRKDGTLSGGGRIYTDVVNNGLLFKKVGENLSMQSLNGDGKLRIQVANANDYMLIDKNLGGTTKAASKDSNISNMSLVLDYYMIDDFVRSGDTFKTSSFIKKGSDTTISGSFKDSNINFTSATLKGETANIDYSDFSANITITRQQSAYTQYANSQRTRKIGDILYDISTTSAINNDTKTQALFGLLDSQSSGAVVATALNDIVAGGNIFSAGLSSSLYLQDSLNSAILWQQSLDHQRDGLNAWITPFATYNKFDGGEGFSKYNSLHFGGLIGIDYHINGSSIGMHTLFLQNTTNAENSSVDSLGIYAGLQGKLSLGVFYMMSALRAGAEFANYSQAVLNLTAKNSATNLVFGGILGLGADFEFGSFSFGPIIYSDLTYFLRGKLSSSGAISSLVPENKQDSFIALNAAAGMKMGFSFSDNVLFDFLAAYKRGFGKMDMSGNVVFVGYKNSALSYSHTLKSRDMINLQADFRIDSGSGFFSNLYLMSDLSKNFMSFSGGLQLGYSFGGGKDTQTPKLEIESRKVESSQVESNKIEKTRDERKMRRKALRRTTK